MARLAHDLFICPRGEDITSDGASLDPLVAQHLVNFNIDRVGILRGQAQLQQISLTEEPTPYANLGVGYLNKVPPLVQDKVIVPTPPALLVVMSSLPNPFSPPPTDLGFLLVYSQDEPATYPPTFTLVSENDDFLNNAKTRFVAFLKNLYIFQDNNAWTNGVVYQDGTIAAINPNALYQTAGMGVPTPRAVIADSLPTGPAVKNGVVQYCCTYVDRDGIESSPSTVPTSVNYGTVDAIGDLISAGGILFTGMQNLSAANIYATLANGAVFYKIATIPWDGFTSSIQDTFPDSVVATGNPMPHFGQNDPPLPASFGCIHKSRFVLNIPGTNQIQISNYNSATQFNSVGIIVDPTTGLVTNPTDGVTLSVGTDASDLVVGLCSIGSVLLIFNRLGTYVLQGNDLRDIAIYPVLTAHGEPIGCVSPDTIARCGVGQNEVWFLARDGVYAVDGGLNIQKVSQPIQSDIDVFSSTVAGCVQMNSANSWYSQHRYHLSIPGDATVWYFDFNQPGPSRWAEYNIETLTNGGINASIQSCCIGVPNESPTLVFLARNDVNTVNLWDTITPDIQVNGMTWVGRPMESFLPYKERAAMGEQEIRAGRKRMRRLRVFGEGTLTHGGTVSMTCDGRTETYAVRPGGQYDPSQAELIYQEWSPACIGRFDYFTLTLNGTGIVIRNATLEYEFVG